MNGGMPKVNIYVPDAMYDELRKRKLPMSRLAQHAFSAALDEQENAAWIARARRRPIRPSGTSTDELMKAVDSEFGA